jgi:hypothetical protein
VAFFKSVSTVLATVLIKFGLILVSFALIYSSINMTLIRSGSKRHPRTEFVNNDEQTVTRAIKNEMIEHVFYTSTAKHINGTNVYEFDYPGEWRTSNAELDFGIRGIYLKKISRTVDIKITIQVTEDDQSITETINYLYVFTPQSTLYDFVNYLNEYWQKSISNEGIKSGFEWRYYPNDNIIIFDKSPISTITDWRFPSVQSDDFLDIGTIEVTGSGHLIEIKMWDRGECLLKASFTNQTMNHHLGYTNIQYYPIKFYHIYNPCPISFEIELFTTSGQPVELPDDGLDYIVLECVVKS